MSVSRGDNDDILSDLLFDRLGGLEGDPTGVVVADGVSDFALRAAMVDAAKLCSGEFSNLSASILVLSVLTTALANEYFLIGFGLSENAEDITSTLVEEALFFEDPRLKTEFADFRAKDATAGFDSRAGVLKLFPIGGKVADEV